jgi:hypothetical protein
VGQKLEIYSKQKENKMRIIYQANNNQYRTGIEISLLKKELKITTKRKRTIKQ